MFVPLSPERANGSFTSFRNTVTGDFVHEIRENILSALMCFQIQNDKGCEGRQTENLSIFYQHVFSTNLSWADFKLIIMLKITSIV